MISRLSRALLAGFFVTLIFSGCARSDSGFDPRAGWSENKAQAMAKLTGSEYWEKRWWLEKTVRVLRGGKGLTSADDVDAWMKLAPEEIVKTLVADVRFANMALDFNLAFLGFRPDRLVDKKYNSSIFAFSTAIASAQEVAKHGDYFKLFDLNGPMFADPPILRRRDGDKGKSDTELLTERIQDFRANFVGEVQWMKNNPSAPASEACVHYNTAFDEQKLLDMGLSGQLLTIGIQFNSSWNLPAATICFASGGKTAADLAPLLEPEIKYYDLLFQQLLALYEDKYSPTTVDQLRTFDLSSVGVNLDSLAYGVRQRVAFTNSSTNMDRKRSAYILKHFFCDDLNPIGIEEPKEHTGGPHGSQTSCYACHYKLDPMAGFFRNYGILFLNFAKGPIVFDDIAVAPVEEYVKNWKASPSSGREWNVGYIRSVDKENLNSYGESLADLHALFKTAPKVKRCLVKRLFEYTVSDQQTLDPSYLDYLADEMSTRAKVNSTDAFKWTVSQLVLSNSFRKPDPDPSQCYDFKPGYDPSDKPPCRVAYIFQQNCVTCHSSTSSYKHLAFNGWVKLPDGTYNFPHLDEGGNQLPASETMQRLMFRLSTPDPSERMPLGGIYMSSQERQELYLWAQKMFGNGGGK